MEQIERILQERENKLQQLKKENANVNIKM